MSEKHTDEMLELAVLSALGPLEGAEADALDLHLKTGCAVCVNAIDAATGVTGALGYAAEEVEPRPELRDAVLSRIAAESALDATPAFETDGVRYVRASGLEWEGSPIPGFDAKLLAFDHGSRMKTQLVRLQPGAEVPAHLHTEVEELYVLEGDLVVNDIVMQAGDYCRAEADSVHRLSRSPNGCLFLAISSDNDKRLEIN